MPVFKLPTWHNTVSVWNWDEGSNLWIEGDEIEGQIYTPLRNSDDDESGLLYFEYPKERDEIRDRWDHNNTGKRDFITFAFPTGAPRTVGYWVEDVLPRWFEFTNEHIIAVLKKMTPAELTHATSGNPDPQTPANETIILHAEPDTQLANNLYEVSVTLRVLDRFGNVIFTGHDFTLTSTGSVTIFGPNPQSSFGGTCTWTARNTVAETTHFTATWAGGSVDSNDVVWTGGGTLDPIDPTNSALVPLDTDALADGVDLFTWRFEARDASNNPLVGRSVTLNMLSSATADRSPVIGTTDGSGNVDLSLNDTVAETVTVPVIHDWDRAEDVTLDTAGSAVFV